MDMVGCSVVGANWITLWNICLATSDHLKTMKHLKSNYASNPQGIGPLFDSVKPKWPNEETISTCAICGKTRPLKEPCDCNDTTFADFDGVTYESKFDATRLRGEMARVYKLMVDGYWRTLVEISCFTGDPEASISARLRDFRKAKFGSHTVNRRRRGDPKRGIFEYQLL